MNVTLGNSALVVAGLGVAALAKLIYTTWTRTAPVPASGPVRAGVKRICIAGTFSGKHDGRAHKLAAAIAQQFPGEYETWYYWTGTGQFFEYVQARFADVEFPKHLKGHATHPFVWIETGADQKVEPIGGRDRFCEWANRTFDKTDANAAILELANTMPSYLFERSDAFHHTTTIPGPNAQIAKK